MKSIVKTSGSFQISEFGQRVLHWRPCVVTRSAFISDRINKGKIIVLDDVPDEARDEEFLEFLIASDYDINLAVASFVSKFKENPVEEPKESEETAEGSEEETDQEVKEDSQEETEEKKTTVTRRGRPGRSKT